MSLAANVAIFSASAYRSIESFLRSRCAHKLLKCILISYSDCISGGGGLGGRLGESIRPERHSPWQVAERVAGEGTGRVRASPGGQGVCEGDSPPGLANPAIDQIPGLTPLY